ncbi:hypothetical protein PLESTB_000349600 [Pleodorina starrii]|uniref:Protein kinase domain-containing protein n=1 Tax=Pleodorina starrii TaxID=330485 RepID=A0A9W6BDN2_9CHLO|nr:hypothetical protein PLESTM_000045400 [Pleodorina starrii]GLC50164.1 hypothetical protein PLESTB_000349600 [Pleodorina starrii]GLC73056.1 hypothetical protein PLESTF_001326900 [Pleodorina starrii]
MAEATGGSNGHLAINLAYGAQASGNVNGVVTNKSAPLFLISRDEEDLRCSGGAACTTAANAPPERRGTTEALDAEKLRSVVEKNSIAAYQDVLHPFAHITRRLRFGKAPGGARVGHAPDTTDKRGNVKKKALLLAVRKDKKVVVVPVLLLFLCMGLGLWGVFAASAQERRQRLTNAQNRAADKAQSIASELRACYLPVKVMQSFVTRYPDFPTLNATFPSLADELLSLTAAGSIANMQLAPLGVLRAIEPLKGNEAALGHDLLADPKNREFALKTIASHNLTLAGPYMLVQGFMGAPARYPIFVRDVEAGDTFGTGRDATNCPICYDPATRTKFWGFATVLIHWDRFVYSVVRIDDLSHQGLYFQLTRPDDLNSSHTLLMAGRSVSLRDPVQVYIEVPNNEWCLSVADSRGWSPNWEWPLVAMVVVMSLLLSVLVGLALVGRAQQRMLLEEVLSANQQLEDAATALLSEKERMEALLRRQYNLIECLGLDPGASITDGGGGGGGGRGGGGGGSVNGGGSNGALGGGVASVGHSGPLQAEVHASPADKIEEMRKKLLTGNRMSGGAGGKGGGGGRPSGGGGGADGVANGGGGGSSNRQSSNGEGGGGGGLPDQELVLGEMIGEGTFGKVYRGLWRSTEVAIKTMILPTNMSGKEKREKMAVMEAAISSSLAHPNVVATYTYQIKPLKDSSYSPHTAGRPSDDLTASAIIVGNDMATTDCGGSCYQQRLDDPLAPFKEDIDEAQGHRPAAAGGGGIHSYEVQLVLEYCDKGCLREALDAGIFFGQTGLNFSAILDTAADVAKALLHLHLNDVVHGDLKADNVMLKSSGREGGGVMAKVADFGLAIKMDHLKTHVSATFQGTLTHMAPEVLLHGQMSKAADVYAFGITLWEMFTGGLPYQGVPGALLGHLISREGKRPTFPPGTPAGFRELAERCWHRDVAQRPGFEEILSTLTALRAAQPSPTPALSYTAMTPEQRNAAKLVAREGAAASLRRRLEEAASARQSSASAPLPRLHHHYHGRKGSGSGAAGSVSGSGAVSSSGAPPAASGAPPPRPHRQPSTSGDGCHPRSMHSPRCGSSRRGGRSRSKGDDPIIMVGGRNVSLSNAITSKSVVLEPISETRFEGDPDAPAQDPFAA